MRRFFYGTLFLLAVVIFLVHYAISGQAVYGDGIGYYSHLHSWVIDGDWDYTNEYKHIYDAEHNNVDTGKESPVVQIVGTTPSGRAENFYGTGVAVLLLPFYLLAHGVSLLANVFGAGLSTQGYGDIYQIFTGIGAIVYAITGVRLLGKTINLVIKNEKISLISAVTVFLATSLLYYGSFDVINSHFASFFLTSLFFYLFLSGGDKKNNLLLGLVAGILTINRVQDGAVILLWLMDSWRRTALNLKAVGRFAIGLSFGLIPMIIHWTVTFGDPLKQTYFRVLMQKYQSNPSIDLWGSLFNPVTGLFLRTPLILILFLFYLYRLPRDYARNDDKKLWYPFVFFVMQFLIITAQGGWSAAAYGGRMYISSLVFFGLVLGKLLLEISKKRMSLVYLFTLVFIAINFVSMGLFILRDKGAEGGTHGTEQRTIKRLEKLINSPTPIILPD
jgi:hypothetical protein